MSTPAQIQCIVVDSNDRTEMVLGQLKRTPFIKSIISLTHRYESDVILKAGKHGVSVYSLLDIVSIGKTNTRSFQVKVMSTEITTHLLF